MTPLEILVSGAVGLVTGGLTTFATMRKSTTDGKTTQTTAEISAVVALLPLMQARITALEGAAAVERKACDERIAALEAQHDGELAELRVRIDEMSEAMGHAIADRDGEARTRLDVEARLKAMEREAVRRGSGEHDAVTVKAPAVPPRGRDGR